MPALSGVEDMVNVSDVAISVSSMPASCIAGPCRVITAHADEFEIKLPCREIIELSLRSIRYLPFFKVDGRVFGRVDRPSSSHSLASMSVEVPPPHQDIIIHGLSVKQQRGPREDDVVFCIQFRCFRPCSSMLHTAQY